MLCQIEVPATAQALTACVNIGISCSERNCGNIVVLMPHLRISEAAELLGLSDDTVRRMADSGRLDTAKDSAGRLTVSGKDLAALAREIANPAPVGAVHEESAIRRTVSSDRLRSSAASEIRKCGMKATILPQLRSEQEMPMFTHAVNASAVAGTSIWQSMFGFEIPATEKILRTLGVYLGLAIIMRLAGKRQLAQLNSFDLIVMLLLSNVVQNAVIGPDNSLIGGLLGAVVLVGFNAALERVATSSKRATRIFEGTSTTLVSDGRIVEKQVRRTGLRDPEVVSALRHQGASAVRDVRQAMLEPGGSISVELNREAESATYGELRQAVLDLQRHLDERLSVLERGDRGALGGEGVPG